MMHLDPLACCPLMLGVSVSIGAFLHQVSYLERVNAELHELLEKYDVESLSQQAALEAEKRQLATHTRQLQQEVGRLQVRMICLEQAVACMRQSVITHCSGLTCSCHHHPQHSLSQTMSVAPQERSTSLMIELDELKASRSTAVAGGKTTGAATSTNPAERSGSSSGDRELMLRQIESLKQV